jgi:hypothetical protein
MEAKTRSRPLRGPSRRSPGTLKIGRAAPITQAAASSHPGQSAPDEPVADYATLPVGMRPPVLGDVGACYAARVNEHRQIRDVAARSGGNTERCSVWSSKIRGPAPCRRSRRVARDKSERAFEGEGCPLLFEAPSASTPGRYKEQTRPGAVHLSSPSNGPRQEESAATSRSAVDHQYAVAPGAACARSTCR